MKRIDSIPGLRDEIDDGIKGGRYWPLLPRHDIYLSATGCDGRRFASLFRETWKRIPLWGRRRMLGHWRATAPTLEGWLAIQQQLEQHGIKRRPDPEPHYWMLPHLELTSDPLRNDVLAWTSDRGDRLKFHGEPVATMPDDVVQDLIAHELAHVMQSADGVWAGQSYPDGDVDYFYRDGTYLGGRLEIEVDADYTIMRWGFDTDSIERWADATGRRKIITIESEEQLICELARSIARGR